LAVTGDKTLAVRAVFHQSGCGIWLTLLQVTG